FGNDINLTQQFDVFNRLTQQQLTHPAQALFDTCTYNYDSINQLIARKNEGVSSHNTNFEYNSLGQLIQQTLAGEQNNKITQYQWDSFGNPQSQTVKSSKSDTDSSEQNTTNTDASSSIDLTRATHSEYKELAPNSSESSSKNSSNADSVVNNECTNNTTINSATDADRLTHFGDSDFYYDEFGNQIRETGKGIKTRREYNAFNQLSCFNNNGTLTQYDYDPLGRRIAKHTEHGKIDYIWDNDQLIGECQHGEYTWYINLPNQFHPVALIKQGEVYYYHLDQLNTPRFVTNSKAEVVWENQADAHGFEEPEAESDFNKESSFTQPIRFQGQYLDEESGLHYNRYRYYSPKQQRFINQDPIGLVGGINHYQYAPNPVNWVDPFGLSCKEKHGSTSLATVISSALLGLSLLFGFNDLTENNPVADVNNTTINHINSQPILEDIKSIGSLVMDDIKDVSTDLWNNRELYAEYFMDDLKSGVIRDQIFVAMKAELEIIGGAAQLATGVMVKKLPLGNSMRTGLLAHGVGNFSSGVGNLSDAIYGGDRDYHFTRNTYENVAEFVGLEKKWGENVFYGVDIAMGVTLLAQPVIQSGNVTIKSSGTIPMSLESTRVIPSIQATPVPMVVNDAYQIFSAGSSISLEGEE
ncbi:RHS repeat domain-containing protein, partial [Pseudoalteromonas sp. Ld18]|uniref:RHS repeat domain-containing protein n=2 Tax=unclassified Pseudoalteromonas TaxID=194690 RepID=UPI00386FF3A9